MDINMKINLIEKTCLEGVTPKSTNRLYWHPCNHKGDKRIWKNKFYRAWRQDMIDKKLPDNFLPNNMSGKGLYIEVGVMEEFDLDNTLKGIIDALQFKYGFNDNEIGSIIAKKVIRGQYATHDYSLDYIKIGFFDCKDLIIDESDTIERSAKQYDRKLLFAHFQHDWIEDKTKDRINGYEATAKYFAPEKLYFHK